MPDLKPLLTWIYWGVVAFVVAGVVGYLIMAYLVSSGRGLR